LINFHFLIQFSETDEHNVTIKLEIIMVSSTSPATLRARAGAILRVTPGNFLEQFDFFLFGFYATYIAHTFFPASSEFASLMMTFAVFGAGFLMRPIGAIVLGAYIDKVGRRKGLITTLSIMAAGTFLIVLRSEEHTSDLQSREKLVCRLLLE